MSTPPRDLRLDFLAQDPVPVSPSDWATPDPADLLPQAVADALLALDGVDGAWIERTPGGQREVVVHISHAGARSAVPERANGLPTRVVGGQPIRAGG